MKLRPEMAVIEIPHQRPAKMFRYRAREQFIECIAEITGETATFDETVAWNGHDLNNMIVIEEAEDLDFYRRRPYNGHQEQRVRPLLAELMEEWDDHMQAAHSQPCSVCGEPSGEGCGDTLAHWYLCPGCEGSPEAEVRGYVHR